MPTAWRTHAAAAMVVTVNVSVQAWQHTLNSAASKESPSTGEHLPSAVSTFLKLKYSFTSDLQLNGINNES